jgi:hypothetical protein
VFVCLWRVFFNILMLMSEMNLCNEVEEYRYVQSWPLSDSTENFKHSFCLP